MNDEQLLQLFNKKIGETMELLEVSNNDALKKPVKKKFWDLLDAIKESKKGDRDGVL
jgi:hypothetical protein